MDINPLSHQPQHTSKKSAAQLQQQPQFSDNFKHALHHLTTNAVHASAQVHKQKLLKDKQHITQKEDLETEKEPSILQSITAIKEKLIILANFEKKRQNG